jgi:hypothetical protein
MIVAFTGTRAGMTDNQKRELWEFLQAEKPTWAYHGNCIGADNDFHVELLSYRAINKPWIYIEVYPCDIIQQQADCCGTADIINPIERPLVRNRMMVDRCDVLIACPRTMTEELRSGTWATIRYARKLKKRIVFLRPDVSELENVFQ